MTMRLRFLPRIYVFPSYFVRCPQQLVCHSNNSIHWITRTLGLQQQAVLMLTVCVIYIDRLVMRDIACDLLWIACAGVEVIKI